MSATETTCPKCSEKDAEIAALVKPLVEALESLRAAFCCVCGGHGPGTSALYYKELEQVRVALEQWRKRG
jgi:hypothetical protein